MELMLTFDNYETIFNSKNFLIKTNYGTKSKIAFIQQTRGIIKTLEITHSLKTNLNTDYGSPTVILEAEQSISITIPLSNVAVRPAIRQGARFIRRYGRKRNNPPDISGPQKWKCYQTTDVIC